MATRRINGEVVTFLHNLQDAQAFDGEKAAGDDAMPPPLPVLDPGNEITRVIDREGNITDYEMHGAAGGPIDSVTTRPGRCRQ